MINLHLSLVILGVLVAAVMVIKGLFYTIDLVFDWWERD